MILKDISNLANQFEKEANFHEGDTFDSVEAFYEMRAKEILRVLSSPSILESNKIPLIKNALLSAFDFGARKAKQQMKNK